MLIRNSAPYENAAVTGDWETFSTHSLLLKEHANPLFTLSNQDGQLVSISSKVDSRISVSCKIAHPIQCICSASTSDKEQYEIHLELPHELKIIPAVQTMKNKKSCSEDSIPEVKSYFSTLTNRYGMLFRLK